MRTERGIAGLAPHRCALAALLSATLLATANGCVARWLEIRSDPPGAQVFLDGSDVGVAPARVSFEHYGTREVMLRLKNHDSVTRVVEVSAPWYQWFPIDLAAEFLWPFEIVDEHVYTIPMTRLDANAIFERIEALGAAEFGDADSPEATVPPAEPRR